MLPESHRDKFLNFPGVNPPLPPPPISSILFHCGLPQYLLFKTSLRSYRETFAASICCSNRRDLSWIQFTDSFPRINNFLVSPLSMLYWNLLHKIKASNTVLSILQSWSLIQSLMLSFHHSTTSFTVDKLLPGNFCLTVNVKENRLSTKIWTPYILKPAGDEMPTLTVSKRLK